MFSFHFLKCNLLICIVFGILLLLKRCLNGKITARSQYHIWYIFTAALILPFIPYRLPMPWQLFSRIHGLFSGRTDGTLSTAFAAASDSDTGLNLGLSDFSAALDHPWTDKWSSILAVIWTTGCIVTAFYFLYNILRIYRLRTRAYLITAENEPELYSQYLSCMTELHIRRQVPLYASCSLSSPVSYGLFRPKIIIPQDMDILLPAQDIRFIFLHELQHYRHRDAALNNLSCLLQIIYWFNPIVWYGFHLLQKDREIACDHSVIHAAGREQSASYGYTLIHYAQQMRQNTFLSPLSHLGGERALILLRIREIAEYKTDSAAKKIRSTAILLLAACLVYAASPLLTAYASQDASFRLTSDLEQKADTLELSSYFQGITGSFVLYDMSLDRYQIYNRELSTERISPDSTFKIYSGLFALEENVITPGYSVQEWDGSPCPFETWNQDQTLASAMSNSVNWYFQNLDAQIGFQALSSYYTRIGYGNCDLSAGIDSYWSEASLKISPIEQVMLLSDLLQNKWDFHSRNIQAVKDAMFISDTSFGRLYGKTGSGIADGQNINGWFVGFLERDGHVYCFAANLQDSDLATGASAAEMTLKILEDYEF